VQRNIRARVFLNLGKNLEMAVRSRYSRSDRIGDLYDRYLYKQLWGAPRQSRKWKRDAQVEVQELPVAPAGDSSFKFPGSNDTRAAKVPALLINATSLNSGHNWRFEAIRMGESLPEDPLGAEIVEEVDKNLWLRPGYFCPERGEPGIPHEQRDFPLGLAVAASACVPGVFQPLAISGMYNGVRVQLVDGGVQDNQGLQGLFDKGCTDLVISDASGQMEDSPTPSARIPGVLGRSASIGGDRIRDGQLSHALARPGGRSALMHLRKGLDARALEPGRALGDAADAKRGSYDTSDFDVHRDIQCALSNIRTDLDYFSDTEAFSLALDGYLMSRLELEREEFADLSDGDPRPADHTRWAFGQDERLVEGIRTGAPATLHRLRAGKQRFFRLFALAPRLGVLTLIALIVAIAFGIGFAWEGIEDVLTSHWPVWPVLSGFVVAAALAGLYAADPRWTPLRIPVALAMGLLLAVASPFLWLWAGVSVATSRRFEI
jgi:NTE family protein